MNDEQRFDRTARTWLEDGPTRAPDRPVAAALAEITTTSQERDLRVPWRFTHMPMLLRVAVAAIAIAVIGGGALFLLRDPGLPGVGVQPTVSPSPSPSATAMTVEAYVAARNAICDLAVSDTDPLRPRFLGVFDGTLSDSQRADWVAALEAFVARGAVTIEQLDRLEPPAALAEGDAETVQAYRDQLENVQAVLDGLRDGRDADAYAADMASEPVNDRITRWERQHVLHHCP